MDSQQIVAPFQIASKRRNIYALEQRCDRIGMSSAGVRIPAWGAVEIAPGHFDAVEIGDKTVIVPNVQCYRAELIRIAVDSKWDADITCGPVDRGL